MVRTTIYSVALCAVAGAAFLAGSLRGSRTTVTAAAVETRTPLYYRCPMHPTYRSDKPGISPCCGMKLEPVYAETAAPHAAAHAAAHDSHATAGTVVASPQQQQVIGVRVGRIDASSGTEHLRLFGRVMADENRTRTINVGVNGYIRDTFDVTTGSYVRKDQPLASFSTVEMRQAIAAYISASDVLAREQKSGASTPSQLQAATGNADQTLERLLTLGMSPVQVREIDRTRVIPNHILVTSPIDGFVVSRRVFAGQKFEAATELFQIADLQRVWILADLQPADANRVKPGTEVEVVGGGRTARARVSTKVLPQFDSATQSMKVRLEAENAGFPLRPDMFVDVHLELPYDAALTVPQEAVVVSGLRHRVFVERSAGIFEPRDVKIGRRVGDRVQIVDGLVAGERVVLSGTFLLDSDSRMRMP
jgi:Cu(I)/Ag(I) efflux system membrane fusion protein